MRVTLKSMLTTFPFTLTKLLAGEENLDREIKNVNIIEVPDVVKWMKGGELLFTAGYAFNGDGAQGSQLLEALMERGIVGLCVKPGKYLKKIPADMVAKARELQFPLLELPEELPYSDYMDPILVRILDEQILVLQKMEDVHEKLIHVMLRNGTMTNICQTLSTLVDNPIYIVHCDGRILCTSSKEDKEPFKGDMSRIVDKFPGMADMKIQRWNRISLPKGETPVVYVPVLMENQPQAYIIMREIKPARELDYIALEHAGMLVALELLQQKAVEDASQRLLGELLYDLLAQNIDEDELLRRSLNMGIDLQAPYQMFEISIKPQKTGGAQDDGQNCRQAVKDIVYGDLKQAGYISKLINRDHKIAGLLSFANTGVMDYKMVLRSSLARIKQTYPQFMVIMGVGRQYTGCRFVRDSFNEAKIAVKAARSINEGSDIVYFSDLGALTFLCELRQSGSMLKFYHEKMHALIQNDKNYQTELIPTLRSYFACGGNIRKTADAMYMHKNSVVYRLKRAQELAGIKLSDPEDAFNLQLCLKLHMIIPKQQYNE